MSGSDNVRVRIAPSPTGDWHLGNARTALFNYLFARHHGGQFYLRIEDTDQTRLVPGAVERLLELLDWLGMPPDSMPNGEPFLRQSENLASYQKVAHELVEQGHAYYCFATADELATMRDEQAKAKQPPHYDDRLGYRDLPLTEAKQRIATGDPYVIRQKMPRDGETVFHDMIHGEVKVLNKLLDDHVILKSDGFPTYHLAHVIDDHDTAITHVIRGDEWLPSAPRHIQLHKALGWELPQYAHVPVILGPDKGKLSKRHGAQPVIAYKEQGYLPDALLNFLVLLGWSSGTEQELFDRQGLIKEFSLERVHPSPAIFNQERLDWFNGHYIRQLSLLEIQQHLLVYWDQHDPMWRARATDNPVKFNLIIRSVFERLVTWHDFAELAAFFYDEPTNYDPKVLSAKGQTPEQTLNALELSLEILEETRDWTHDSLEHLLRTKAEHYGLKAGAILWPIRAALTGLPASPSTFDVLVILGRDESLRRLRHAITLLRSL